MKEPINFKFIDSTLEARKNEVVQNRSGENYVLCVLSNILDPDEIDFTQFNLNDVRSAQTCIDGLITDEDTEGNISIDPNNPYTVIVALSYKFKEMGRIPRQRAFSPFLFI